MNKKVFGWFEGHEETPSYDPGMEGTCPACGFKLSLVELAKILMS